MKTIWVQLIGPPTYFSYQAYDWDDNLITAGDIRVTTPSSWFSITAKRIDCATWGPWLEPYGVLLRSYEDSTMVSESTKTLKPFVITDPTWESWLAIEFSYTWNKGGDWLIPAALIGGGTLALILVGRRT